MTEKRKYIHEKMLITVNSIWFVYSIKFKFLLNRFDPSLSQD